MFGQSFAPHDLAVVAFLVLLEALLSGDNALVLAIMVRHLPREQQRKALLYGLGGAFVFRLGAILLAAQIISLWWLQGLGALYLLVLPIRHFTKKSAGAEARPVGTGFWRTVVAVELADIAFALDSVLAGVALVKDRGKIWVVYTGAVIGIVLLRLAASVFVRLLERYPTLDHLAYILVGWVGLKLAFMSGHHGVVWYDEGHPQHPLGYVVPMMADWLFWGVMIAVCAIGTSLALRRPGCGDAEYAGKPEL